MRAFLRKIWTHDLKYGKNKCGDRTPLTSLMPVKIQPTPMSIMRGKRKGAECKNITSIASATATRPAGDSSEMELFSRLGEYGGSWTEAA